MTELRPVGHTHTTIPRGTADQLDELVASHKRRFGMSSLGRSYALVHVIFGEVARRKAGDIPDPKKYKFSTGTVRLRIHVPYESLAWLDWLVKQDRAMLDASVPCHRSTTLQMAIPRELDAYRKSLAVGIGEKELSPS